MIDINKRAAGLLLFGLVPMISLPAISAERRQIEEIVVTAEKREATVSDTSISITAFSADSIEDFGLQSADEMVNFIPATTRDAYDIRIRGVGRNFRSLGGDPGVATYYNGVYSPDFGIAASENALYDLERIEVLRGPQGTLYGRNSIGGALNYVTKKATFEPEGQVRVQMGDFSTREVYVAASTALIDDVLAGRIILVDRERDGNQDNVGGGPAVNSTNDRNYAFGLSWQINDAIAFHVRANDRLSDRVIGLGSFLTEGNSLDRGVASTNRPVLGLRAVAAGDPLAIGTFTNPATGEVRSAAYRRPGQDSNGFPFTYNSRYNDPHATTVMGSQDDPLQIVSVNNENCAKWPYTTDNCNHELFGHRSVQTELTWDISDTMAFRYIYGNTDFDYTFNIDNDYSDAQFTQYRQIVEESVWNYSHEFQLDWAVGDNWSATTGIFFYNEMRSQKYGLNSNEPRFTEPANYGDLDLPTAAAFGLGTLSILQASGTAAPHVQLWDAAEGKSIAGRWDGDASGKIYLHNNRVHNEQFAAYSQGTYVINDEFALVLGIRYAKDEKAAREVRGGYFEFASWFSGFLHFGIGPNSFGLPADATTGLTPLGQLNIAMGRATFSGNPADPLTPKCAYDAVGCSDPLTLGLGVPISYTSHVAGDDTWSDTNYRINLDWTPNDDILMYFSVTTGYRAGGFSLGISDAKAAIDPITGLADPAADLSPLTYDEETVTSLELGYKGLHLDGTFQLNMSLYQYAYDGYQDEIGQFDPVRGVVVATVQNANSATNRGFEVEGLWLPTDELTLGGNYSFTDAFYDETYPVVFTDDPSIPESVWGGPNAVQASGLTNYEEGLYVYDLKGQQLKRIPAHKASMWASYLVELDNGSLTFGGTYSYTGEYSAAGLERPIDIVPGRSRFDLSVKWNDNDNKWGVRLFVDNVTDESNLRGIGTAGEGQNWRMTGAVLYPRYWGIDVRYNMGGYR